MAPRQGTSAGVPYARRLFEHADLAWSRGGPLTEAFVKSLWKLATQGGTVTWSERRTLEYIREEYNLSASAKALLDERMLRHFSKVIKGVCYDKGILDEVARRANSGQMDKQDLVRLWTLANDGCVATPVQRLTFEHVLQRYRVSAAGRLYLMMKLRATRAASTSSSQPSTAASSSSSASAPSA